VKVISADLKERFTLNLSLPRERWHLEVMNATAADRLLAVIGPLVKNRQ
jgi:hypothetical protein